MISNCIHGPYLRSTIFELSLTHGPCLRPPILGMSHTYASHFEIFPTHGLPICKALNIHCKPVMTQLWMNYIRKPS